METNQIYRALVTVLNVSLLDALIVEITSNSYSSPLVSMLFLWEFDRSVLEIFRGLSLVAKLIIFQRGRNDKSSVLEQKSSTIFPKREND